MTSGAGRRPLRLRRAPPLRSPPPPSCLSASRAAGTAASAPSPASISVSSLAPPTSAPPSSGRRSRSVRWHSRGRLQVRVPFSSSVLNPARVAERLRKTSEHFEWFLGLDLGLSGRDPKKKRSSIASSIG